MKGGFFWWGWRANPPWGEGGRQQAAAAVVAVDKRMETQGMKVDINCGQTPKDARQQPERFLSPTSRRGAATARRRRKSFFPTTR